MNDDHFLFLVSKKFSGEASLKELQELDSILLSNPDYLKQYKLLSQYWEQQDNPNQVFVEGALQKALLRLNLPANPFYEEAVSKRKRFFLFTGTAAACVAAVAIAFLLFSQLHESKDVPASLAGFEKKQNSKGTKSTIQLADGSKVWLNADSKIQYPELFEGNTREVYLNGEAFFDVIKNAKKPFIIHLANGTVRVLGTSFNIRAYDNEKSVETSVATGKVAFIPSYKGDARRRDTVFITPNNKVSYTYSSEKLSILPTLPADDKAWIEGRLIFKAMSLHDIAIELERNFGKNVVFLDDALKDYILTGSFKNNTLEEVMYYLSKTKGFYYKITNTELLIAATPDQF